MLPVIRMKQIIVLISILLTLNLFGQEPTEKVGEIEVQIIGHHYKRNSDYELTKKKTNRQNRPFSNLYFDSYGTLLKTIGYGKHHNTDLRLLDNIHIYNYDSNGVKSRVEIWETDYEKNLLHKYYETFELDSTKSKILSETMYHFETDSIFIRTDYWYNKKGQYQGIIFDSTYYYKREFNSENQLVNLQQIYDGKLRWEWKYTYSTNQREGIFQTFYNDGKDYSQKEIQTYNNQGGLIESEEVQVSKEGLNKKTKIYYDKNGIIKKIEYYDSFNEADGYELISYSEIIVKSKTKIDSQIAEKINGRINIK
jgi:hypothetical protein